MSRLPMESQYFRLWGALRRKSRGGGPSIATISARRCASECSPLGPLPSNKWWSSNRSQSYPLSIIPHGIQSSKKGNVVLHIPRLQHSKCQLSTSNSSQGWPREHDRYRVESTHCAHLLDELLQSPTEVAFQSLSIPSYDGTAAIDR